jgi:hypothetical protein
MIKIETGCKTIFRYDNILDTETCKKIYDCIIPLKSPSNRSSIIPPWEENNTFCWFNDLDISIAKKIFQYRMILTELVCELYKKKYYIESTTINLWNTNKFMPLHKDTGNDNEGTDFLYRRKITVVTYINDNFEGGETFIKNETGIDYIIKPKEGSVVMMLSDESNSHGVKKVISGMRLTITLWFCEKEDQSEDKRLQDIYFMFMD